MYVHDNNAFLLPRNGDSDGIMVCTGTGIAPFRAILGDRKSTTAKGENLLFFGNPHCPTDYLY